MALGHDRFELGGQRQCQIAPHGGQNCRGRFTEAIVPLVRDALIIDNVHLSIV
jgi:hypothetical protein